MVAYPLSSALPDLDYPKLAWQFVTGDFDGDDSVGLADFPISAPRWFGIDSSLWGGGGWTDLTNYGNVSFNALRELAENWLADTSN